MKILKLTIWAVALGLLPLITLGQIESYPIKDYKLPVIKRTSLDLGASTNSAGLTGNVKGDSVEKTTDSRNDFNGQGQANWNYYYRSPKWQTGSSASVSISGDAQTRNAEQAPSKNESDYSYINTSLSAYNSSLYYFRENIFTSFSPHGGIDYSSYKFSRKYIDNAGTMINDTTTYYNNSSSNVGMGLGVGYGRIEPVSDAHKMVFTLLDLKKSGRLLREPSTDEITQISQTLSSLKNERYFDNREHSIKEVTILDSLLTSMGLTSKGGIGVSTALYDNLAYAYMPQRYSGFLVKVEPIIGYSNTSTKQTGQDRFKSNQLTLGANANLTYETPINIYWQRTIKLGTSYENLDINTKNGSSVNIKRNDKVSKVELSAGYGYYPNTRTNLNFMLGGRFTYFNSDMIVNSQPYKSRVGELFADGSLYYYLSPKVRIDARAQLTYKTNIDAKSNLIYSSLYFQRNLYDTFTTKELSYTFSARLTYALF